MTDIEQWEPSNTDQALAVLDQWTKALDSATTVEEVTAMRGEAEAVWAWVRRRDESESVALRAQEFIRNAERKLAELMEELREAGKVRKAGRPRKSESESPITDEESETNSPIVPREVFGDDKTRRDAYLFASVNEDEWTEALAAARESGDMSRAALVRMLRTPRAERTAARDNGNIPTIGSTMPRAIKALTNVADALSQFVAETVEHEDRKEWKAAIREQVGRIDAWQKALPR